MPIALPVLAANVRKFVMSRDAQALLRMAYSGTVQEATLAKKALKIPAIKRLLPNPDAACTWALGFFQLLPKDLSTVNTHILNRAAKTLLRHTNIARSRGAKPPYDMGVVYKRFGEIFLVNHSMHETCSFMSCHGMQAEMYRLLIPLLQSFEALRRELAAMSNNDIVMKMKEIEKATSAIAKFLLYFQGLNGRKNTKIIADPVSGKHLYDIILETMPFAALFGVLSGSALPIVCEACIRRPDEALRRLFLADENGRFAFRLINTPYYDLRVFASGMYPEFSGPTGQPQSQYLMKLKLQVTSDNDYDSEVDNEETEDCFCNFMMHQFSPSLLSIIDASTLNIDDKLVMHYFADRSTNTVACNSKLSPLPMRIDVLSSLPAPLPFMLKRTPLAPINLQEITHFLTLAQACDNSCKKLSVSYSDDLFSRPSSHANQTFITRKVYEELITMMEAQLSDDTGSAVEYLKFFADLHTAGVRVFGADRHAPNSKRTRAEILYDKLRVSRSSNASDRLESLKTLWRYAVSILADLSSPRDIDRYLAQHNNSREDLYEAIRRNIDSCHRILELATSIQAKDKSPNTDFSKSITENTSSFTFLLEMLCALAKLPLTPQDLEQITAICSPARKLCGAISDFYPRALKASPDVVNTVLYTLDSVRDSTLYGAVASFAFYVVSRRKMCPACLQEPPTFGHTLASKHILVVLMGQKQHSKLNCVYEEMSIPKDGALSNKLRDGALTVAQLEETLTEYLNAQLRFSLPRQAFHYVSLLSRVLSATIPLDADFAILSRDFLLSVAVSLMQEYDASVSSLFSYSPASAVKQVTGEVARAIPALSHGIAHSMEYKLQEHCKLALFDAKKDIVGIITDALKTIRTHVGHESFETIGARKKYSKIFSLYAFDSKNAADFQTVLTTSRSALTDKHNMSTTNYQLLCADIDRYIKRRQMASRRHQSLSSFNTESACAAQPFVLSALPAISTTFAMYAERAIVEKVSLPPSSLRDFTAFLRHIEKLAINNHTPGFSNDYLDSVLTSLILFIDVLLVQTIRISEHEKKPKTDVLTNEEHGTVKQLLRILATLMFLPTASVTLSVTPPLQSLMVHAHKLIARDVVRDIPLHMMLSEAVVASDVLLSLLALLLDVADFLEPSMRTYWNTSVNEYFEKSVRGIRRKCNLVSARIIHNILDGEQVSEFALMLYAFINLLKNNDDSTIAKALTAVSGSFAYDLIRAILIVDFSYLKEPPHSIFEFVAGALMKPAITMSERKLLIKIVTVICPGEAGYSFLFNKVLTQHEDLDTYIICAFCTSIKKKHDDVAEKYLLLVLDKLVRLQYCLLPIALLSGTCGTSPEAFGGPAFDDISARLSSIFGARKAPLLPAHFREDVALIAHPIFPKIVDAGIHWFVACKDVFHCDDMDAFSFFVLETDIEVKSAGLQYLTNFSLNGMPWKRQATRITDQAWFYNAVAWYILFSMLPRAIKGEHVFGSQCTKRISMAVIANIVASAAGTTSIASDSSFNDQFIHSFFNISFTGAESPWAARCEDCTCAFRCMTFFIRLLSEGVLAVLSSRSIGSSMLRVLTSLDKYRADCFMPIAQAYAKAIRAVNTDAARAEGFVILCLYIHAISDAGQSMPFNDPDCVPSEELVELLLFGLDMIEAGTVKIRKLTEIICRIFVDGAEAVWESAAKLTNWERSLLISGL